MTRGNKILLGILAFFPIGYILFFMLFIAFFILSMFTTMATTADPSGRLPPPMMGPFFALFGLHFLAMLVMFGQVIAYIVLLFRNPRLRDNERIIWLLVILLAGAIGAPIYWYMHIWKAPDVPNTLAAPPS